MIELNNITKKFTLHNQGRTNISVFKNLNLKINPGEIVALTGPSGVGKSSILKMIYGNYVFQSGEIKINNYKIDYKYPRNIIELRKNTIGYVSQFLRVIPRVPTIEIVMEPLLEINFDQEEVRERAEKILLDLNIDKNLWNLSPLTFSGGEQQRVNVARGLIRNYPCLLLDEPTASLDNVNKDIVLNLINEKKDKGSSIIGIFHDESSRKYLNAREIDITKISHAN
ncbi:phosphonate C-P lyase system protein PhnL [Pelagibacterales bacterium SAG-MED10]|jgi:alpha-D-ribose 1-methylphosphonate 5-triphosphate synthase subunit PhnL|nr:phosphonate C-P lyase system protein PhnL [Pelagibacterales bacterium SAG-MED10]